MNARSMPRAPLIIIGGYLAVLDMHPNEHGALDRQNAGSDHVSAGCQRKVAGMMTLTVYINSRGNASRDRTSFFIRSNIKTFMTPDAAYTSAAAGSYQRMYDELFGH
jgi:hypothetical protein